MRIAFFVSEDYYFLSHRVELARAAARDGWEVHLVTNRTEGVRIDPEDPFEVHALQVDRSSVNPVSALATLFRLHALLRSIKPDLLHNVALKPIVVGTLAARLAGVPAVINAVAGMGFVFSSDSGFARLVRPFVKAVLSWALRSRISHAVLQNRDDRDLVVAMGVPPARVSLIRGSGVDTERFVPRATEPPGPPVVRFLARLLEDKGAREFVAAARMLKPDFPDVRFVLSGGRDDGNPAAVQQAELDDWEAGGTVELTGRIHEVVEAWHASHLAVLPSYREGLPMSLLEAAACGLPIVTTDVPGCREVVIDGCNGLLVRVRDPAALAAAMRVLLLDPALRRTMGDNGVELVRAEMSRKVIDGQFLALYRTCLGGRSRAEARPTAHGPAVFRAACGAARSVRARPHAALAVQERSDTEIAAALARARERISGQHYRRRGAAGLRPRVPPWVKPARPGRRHDLSGLEGHGRLLVRPVPTRVRRPPGWPDRRPYRSTGPAAARAASPTGREATDGPVRAPLRRAAAALSAAGSGGVADSKPGA